MGDIKRKALKWLAIISVIPTIIALGGGILQGLEILDDSSEMTGRLLTGLVVSFSFWGMSLGLVAPWVSLNMLLLAVKEKKGRSILGTSLYFAIFGGGFAFLGYHSIFAFCDNLPIFLFGYN
jgi:hypothetical protein